MNIEEKLEELKLAINPSLNAVGSVISEKDGHNNGLDSDSVSKIIELLLIADNNYLEAYDEGFEDGKTEETEQLLIDKPVINE